MEAEASLIDRIRDELGGQGDLTEDRVFDGVGFFIRGRMAMAVLGDAICLHLDSPISDSGEGKAEPFIFAGRPVPGWVSISARDLDDKTLARWVEKGLAGISSPM